MENNQQREVIIQVKVPFNTNVRLRLLKKQTGANMQRLVNEAIRLYLESIDNGTVTALSLKTQG